MILADQGAEVIKIERPGKGDPAREMAPIKRNEAGEKNSGYYLRFNRNKKSVTLDVTKPEGRAVYKDLVRTADVVVENFKPGLAERLGIGYQALREQNPRLVYTSVSGFGSDPRYLGPYSDRPAYDIIAQAMGGLLETCGLDPEGPPTYLGVSLGDSVSGLCGVRHHAGAVPANRERPGAIRRRGYVRRHGGAGGALGHDLLAHWPVDHARRRALHRPLGSVPL